MDENEEVKVVKPKKVKEKKDKKDKKPVNKTVIISIIMLFIGAALMYLLIYYVLPINNKVSSSAGTSSTSTGVTTASSGKKEVTVTDNGIADAVEKLYDAVVVVTATENGEDEAGGTGFVYKVDGNKAYILTNNHVISGTNGAKVTFTNDKTVDAKIVGGDASSDTAVLSVSKDDVIAVATIGSSTNARVGDTVFAIGSPVSSEYSWTVTRGIVSGKDRMVEASTDSGDNSYAMKVIQTDASINNGNSGGPLANANGEVIGITNMKIVSNAVEGIGFAIPIEDAVTIADELVKDGKVTRPLLGVSMMDLSNKYNLYMQGITLNTELTEGVVAVKIQGGSPADKGGLKRGDIITKIDDDKVKDVASLRYALYKHKVGDTITVTYERNGKSNTTKVKLTVAN